MSEPTYDRLGAVLPGRLAKEKYLRELDQAAVNYKSRKWQLGDLFAYGVDHYEELTPEVLSVRIGMTGEEAQQTIYNVTFVCRHVKRAQRREDLSFSHHAEVASLKPEEQERWLNVAARDSLSCNRFRALIAGKTSEGKQPEATGNGKISGNREPKQPNIAIGEGLTRRLVNRYGSMETALNAVQELVEAHLDGTLPTDARFERLEIAA